MAISFLITIYYKNVTTGYKRTVLISDKDFEISKTDERKQITKNKTKT